jgi:uroporphyrinogen decarboxylase
MRDCDFINACYGRMVRRRPIWVMRQAGRYQESYRAVRQRYTFEQVCSTPELIAQVTTAPISEFGLDAAIIFSDILVVFPPMGVPVSFEDGGPRLSAPIRTAADLSALKKLDVEKGLKFVSDGIRQTRLALPANIPLIGFAGAPFTLACYAIEGTTSREFTVARRFFHENPKLAEKLMSHLAVAVSDYLNTQIEAGVDAVQLFDSWGGLLSSEDYRRWVIPHMHEIVSRVKIPNVPMILYLSNTSHLLDVISEVGFDVVSIDWRTELNAAAHHLSHAKAIQGNLDPLAMYADSETIIKRAKRIMGTMDSTGKGHIFNLGHGILPSTPEENMRTLVETVHATPPKLI